jgi:hypothetical protein
MMDYWNYCIFVVGSFNQLLGSGGFGNLYLHNEQRLKNLL